MIAAFAVATLLPGGHAAGISTDRAQRIRVIAWSLDDLYSDLGGIRTN
jgi:hypothetical protein